MTTPRVAALAQPRTATLGQDPSTDVARLDARYPIALFPVRIETRWDTPSSSLLIRVYPDEILADAHDPTLTADEQKWGNLFWSESTSLDPATAWHHLVANVAAPRASWIVIATDPAATTPPVIRAHPWSRAVDAPLLPDRWIAIGYRGGNEVARASSSFVVEPLNLTVDPTAPTAGNIDVSGGLGLTLDPGVVWTVDFTKAVAAGMAFSMKLTQADFAAGLERLLVYGVKSSITPADAASEIKGLFDAQHYSRGWAFVPQGTPTNDSRDAPSGYPLADPNGAVSFAVERGASLATAGGDGVAWASALGVSTDVVAHVHGADDTEQQSAAAMTRALFPATWGYYLDNMMAPNVAASTVDALREYMVSAVRARGPLPAFRIGDVPYGVLPVTSLTRWTAGGRGIDAALPNLLRQARSIWAAQVKNAPHIGRSTDADGDLLDVMSMDASARAIRLRRVLGQDAQWNIAQLFGMPWGGWATASELVAQEVLATAGLPNIDTAILNAVFADTAPKFRYNFASDAPASETKALDPNYITWIRTASVLELQFQNFPSAPNALLYRLLRYAALVDAWREARTILLANGVAASADLREHELVGIAPGTEQRLTPWDHFAQPVSGVTASLTLGDYLSPIRAGQAARTIPPELTAFRSALATLEPLPTAELERLTTETLDLASSRLDAWITSLPTTRLGAMRAANPTGVNVGAFAWLENLSPNPTANATGGYIHTPSMTHAAAAAVLRNGFLTNASNAAPGATPYAINLTSARTRAARFVLDAVREGQAVGAVFGYQVERGLHERQVEVLIEPLRNLYAIVANKTVDSGQTADMVAARNVVDGLQLRTAWRAGTIPWGSSGLPAAGAQRTALEAILGELDDTVDAVADLLLAEAVFQLVRGSTAGTSATLDALAQGVRPPDPDVAHPLRGGTDLTHRVAIIMGGAPLALPTGWPAAATPRAAAEPRLDWWVGTILGDPSNVKCTVSTPAGSQTVSLDMLNVRPLDLLAMSAAVLGSGQVSELDRRIVYAALGDGALPAGTPSVDYTRQAGWDRTAVRTVPELLELAQAVTRLIGGTRPLGPQDLVRPADASNAVGTGLAVAEAEGRATTAETALAQAITDLKSAVAMVPANTPPTPAQLTALRTALREASLLGVSAAYPAPGAGLDAGGVDTTPLAQAVSVLGELQLRQTNATAAHLPAAPPPTDAQRVAAAAAIAGAVFGRNFVFLAGCTPPPASNMAAALAASAGLVGDAHAVGQWLQQASRVRDPLARWRRVRLLGDAAGGSVSPEMDVVQLPVAAGARWGALPFASPADRVSGRLSLVLHRPATPPATDNWFGLVVDEWVELIPNATESTGLAFHYDDPGAEAAQAVLLAVPPNLDTDRWNEGMLVDTLNETLDLAKIRAVDLSLLGLLGQLLPAIFFAANDSDDTITVNWVGTLRTDTTITAVKLT